MVGQVANLPKSPRRLTSHGRLATCPTWPNPIMDTAIRRKPGRPPSEEIRNRRCEEILEAAAKLFAEHGYTDAATQALADMLHVGKGTLYRYFPTKQELFLAAVDRLMHQLSQSINERIEGVADPFEQMLRAIEAYLEFSAKRPEFVELLIQERAQFKDRKKPTYFAHREANAVRWREEFRKLIAQGYVRDVPPERITEVIGDLLYGTMFCNQFAGRKVPPREQARDIMDIVLQGVCSDAERRAGGSRSRGG